MQSLLEQLAALRAQGHEIIVVDGGSTDATLAQLVGKVDHLLVSKTGRACQMHVGAEQASGEVLWFVHADSILPATAVHELQRAIQALDYSWGYFDIRLSGSQRMFRIIERLVNLRSRWTGVATGDQGMFVRREQYFAVGGFPPQLLMEDIELSKRLRKCSKPYCVNEKITTSSRRWERGGVFKTIALMWGLRLAYYCGVPANKLHAWYYP